MKPVHARAWLPGVTFLLLLGIPAAGFSQPSTWEYIGPEGGTLSAVAQDPLNADIVYVATNTYPSAIFRSTNRGEEWSKVSSISYGYVTRLIIPPAAPTTLLATTWGQIHRSTDGGGSWVTVHLPSSAGRNYYMYDLALDPANAQIFHVASEGWDGSMSTMTYLKSTDGGSNWVIRELSSDASVALSVAVDPLNPQAVYVGGYTMAGGNTAGKLMKSEDGGETFADATSSILGYVYVVYVDSTLPGRAFVGTYAGAFKSTDSGATWKQTYIPTPYYFQVNPANPSEVYAGTSIGVVKSTTGGDSWRDASTGIQGGGVGGLVLDPSSPGDLVFVNSAGVYRTTNAGALWSGCNCGILAARISALRCAPSSPTDLYAAFYGNAVYKATAATAPDVLWDRLPQFYDCHNLEDILILPTDPNVLYAMEGGG